MMSSVCCYFAGSEADLPPNIHHEWLVPSQALFMLKKKFLYVGTVRFWGIQARSEGINKPSTYGSL